MKKVINYYFQLMMIEKSNLVFLVSIMFSPLLFIYAAVNHFNFSEDSLVELVLCLQILNFISFALFSRTILCLNKTKITNIDQIFTVPIDRKKHFYGYCIWENMCLVAFSILNLFQTLALRQILKGIFDLDPLLFYLILVPHLIFFMSIPFGSFVVRFRPIYETPQEALPLIPALGKFFICYLFPCFFLIVFTAIILKVKLEIYAFATLLCFFLIESSAGF